MQLRSYNFNKLSPGSRIFSVLLLLFLSLHIIFAVWAIFESAFLSSSGNISLEAIDSVFTQPVYKKVFTKTCIDVFFAWIVCILASFVVSTSVIFYKRTTQIYIIVMFLFSAAFPSVLSAYAVFQFFESFLFSFSGISGRPLMIFGYVYLFFPYMLLSIAPTVLKIPKEYFEAARDLGATKCRIFLHIILPLSYQGVIIGSLIVLPSMLFDVVVPDVLGRGTIRLSNLLWSVYFDFARWMDLSVIIVLYFMIFLSLSLLILLWRRYGRMR